MSISYLSDTETPLVAATVDGSVDFKGRPVYRASSGGWRSARFIIGVEMAERFAYYGIQSNLVTYLTGPLGQSTATAAENVNLWLGMAMLLPLLGAFVADSFLGRYRTIIIASVIYCLGLGLLTLSAMLPSVSPVGCQNTNEITSCGHKPCVQAFGADQFDGKDPLESKLKSSFFNWCKTYRCSIKGNERSPFLRIGKVFVVAVRNWRQILVFLTAACVGTGLVDFISYVTFAIGQGEHKPCVQAVCPDQFGGQDPDPEELMCLLFPLGIGGKLHLLLWLLKFERKLMLKYSESRAGFNIPAASLKSFITLAIVLTVPIYDCFSVPKARAFTGKPAGITMLQRSKLGRFYNSNECVLVDSSICLGCIFGVGSFLSSFLISVIEKATGGDGHESWFAANNLNRARPNYLYWLLAGLSAAGLVSYLYFAKSYIYNNRTSSNQNCQTV
ncbi:hypothetical protein Pint_07433 [Pistacia integerrima]|uniref:Uncharacterized protein n=1 Tax=Pistacia integerrima TaxID=434235 RepID=A0ACC0XWA1_9ROSI|nr:hypothetical protein Pint_07433 [Pistacia integerrima]